MYNRTGKLVHFVLHEGPSKGRHRPAFIVEDWGKHSEEPGAVNLQVFTDSPGPEHGYQSNDYLPAVMWVASVPYDAETKLPYTWHFPEND